MQDFPISGLFDEDGLSTAMLVAAGDIVVEGELCWRGHALGLSGLSDCDVLPFAFALIFQKIEVDLIEAFIDGMGNDGLGLLELTVHLQ